MAATDRHKPLSTLIAKARVKHAHAAGVVLAVPAHDPASGRPCPFHADRLLRVLVHSYLVWESGTSAADMALARLCAAVVDANELRVSLVDEIVELLAGPADPRAHERALRLKGTLNALFESNHRLTLDHLSALNKKAAWSKLVALAQLPRFVAARIALVGLGVHAMPVDGAMVLMLTRAKAITADAGQDSTPDAIAGVIERLIPAGELLEVYACLQASTDAELAARPANISTLKGAIATKPQASGKAPARTKASEDAKASPGAKPPANGEQSAAGQGASQNKAKGASKSPSSKVPRAKPQPKPKANSVPRKPSKKPPGGRPSGDR